MKLSIITPTYNRAHLLPKLYKSLQSQTSDDFEWIIIDDGSSDETETLVRGWIGKDSFTIQYIKKENSGKHTALNASHKYINAEIVLIVDSDDWLVKEAVETIIRDWSRYGNDPKICGITYLRGEDETHSLKGGHFRCQEEVSDFITVKVNYCKDIGSCEVIRADVLREFPFPEFQNERFIGESYLWYNSGLKYKTVYIDKILYITEYFADGLTVAGRNLRLSNPMGGMEVTNLGMSKGIKLKIKIKNALLYNCYGARAKIPFHKILRNARTKWIVILCYYPAKLLNLYWNNKFKS